jgi:hypothetical protein
MKLLRTRTLLLTGVVCLAVIALGHPTQLVEASPPSVSAGSIQRWSVSTGHFALNFFGDGTLLATKSAVVVGPQVPGGNGVEAVKIDPATGGIIGSIYSPNVRTTIRLGSGSQQDWIMGGYENWSAFGKDGSYIKLLFPLGCCNVPRYPFAFDHINDRAYLAANSGIGYVDLNTDARPGLGITGICLADSRNRLEVTAGSRSVRWELHSYIRICTFRRFDPAWSPCTRNARRRCRLE